MKEIITKNNTVSTKVAKRMAEIECLMIALKAEQDEYKKALLEAMEKNGIIKLDSNDITISYIAPTTRETFDAKTFRTEHPDMYDEYVKISDVKASLRIKVKD